MLQVVIVLCSSISLFGGIIDEVRRASSCHNIISTMLRQRFRSVLGAFKRLYKYQVKLCTELPSVRDLV